MIGRALTIAGSDSSGGAGIQQDLKTFQVFGVWGMTAVTAVTVQNSVGVEQIHPIPAGIVAAQIAAVVNDIGVDAVKTGMLATGEIVESVARTLGDIGVARLVVDPVLGSSSGDSLAGSDVAEAIRTLLLPLATVVTPNVAEATALTGIDVRDLASQAAAARALVSMGAAAALVTGGHLEGDAVDVLALASGEVIELRAERVATAEGHGTGCALSAALTACLARGLDVGNAAREAKGFVAGALRHALRLGKGAGPVNPVWRETKEPPG